MKTNIKLVLLGFVNIFIWLLSFIIYIYYYRISTENNNLFIQCVLYGGTFFINIYLMLNLTKDYLRTKDILISSFMPIIGYLFGIGIVILDFYSRKSYSLFSMLVKWAVANTNDQAGYASLATGLLGLLFLAIVLALIVTDCIVFFIIKIIQYKRKVRLHDVM